MAKDPKKARARRLDQPVSWVAKRMGAKVDLSDKEAVYSAQARGTEGISGRGGMASGFQRRPKTEL